MRKLQQQINGGVVEGWREFGVGGGALFLIVRRWAKCFSGWRVYCLPPSNFRRPREEETVSWLFVTWTGSPTRGKSQIEIGSPQMLSDILEFARSWNSLDGKVTCCLHGLGKISPHPHPPISCPGYVILQTGAMAEAIIAQLSLRRPEFDLGEVRVIFVVDRVGMGRVFI